MKHIILIILITSLNANANPVQVANNVLNEYLQVVETVNIYKEKLKQLQKIQEAIDNMSGVNKYLKSQLENQVNNWHPYGDDLLDPSTSTDYGKKVKSLTERLAINDLLEAYGIKNDTDYDNKNWVKYQTEKNHNETAIAGVAFGDEVLKNSPKRNEVVKKYLDKVGEAETLKESTDLQGHLVAQQIYSQIQINNTLAMLLKMRSAKAQKVIASEKWTHEFLKKRVEK